MAITRPTGEQIQFSSSKTGIHVLDTYLEATEAGGRTLPDLIVDLFDDITGDLKAFDFRMNANVLEYRVGTGSWLPIYDLSTFRQEVEDWARKTGATVGGVDYSSKEYAIGTTVPAGSAKKHATDAATSASAASTSEGNAASHEVQASKWASESENVEVVTGKYSAYHYAQKAAASADNASGKTVSDTDGDTTINTEATSDEDKIRVRTAGSERAVIDASGLTITGNIAVSGNVDGRDVSADGSKLDGVQSGAQVNPSSTDALTEGTSNLYYTDARAAAASPVQSVNGQTADVVINLDTINDVDLTTAAPASGNSLVFDGANWVPGAGGPNITVSSSNPSGGSDGDLWFKVV